MATVEHASTARAPVDGRGAMIGGMRAAVPLAVAVFGFAVSFGIVAQSAGIDWWPALLMSATTFAGSAQFAAASVIDSGGGVAAATIAAILLNSRYLPMGISLAPAMTGGAVRRFMPSLLVCDESWAVSHVGKGLFSRSRLIGSGLLIWAAWVGGTAVGMLGADMLGDPETLGLDVAAPAIFLALLVGQVRERRAVLAAVLGALIALLLAPIAPPGVPLVIAIAGALVGLKGSGK